MPEAGPNSPPSDGHDSADSTPADTPADSASGHIPRRDRRDLAAQAMALFSPSGPVTEEDLFAGRVAQMQAVISATNQAGQHAVVFGERGVGKTSLAATIVDIHHRSGRVAVRTNCDGTDDFSSIWRKALDEIQLEREISGIGFGADTSKLVSSLAESLPQDEKVSPNDVRKLLTVLGRTTKAVIFLDEFDRIDDEETRSLFADTIKTLSDQLVPVTLVLVGVADNVDELVQEHRSVERALIQIHMPRMSSEELSEIVNRVRTIALEMDRDARREITHLSQGLPQYAHQLAQYAAVAAIARGTRAVTLVDVEKAIAKALEQAQESVASAYHRATMSTRETLYREVLLACALAPGDDLGYFASGDVRAPLSEIMGRPYDIPAFSQHLNELSDSRGTRGPVFQKVGTTRKFRFRFINPLLQPYVIMRGLNDSLISREQVKKLRDASESGTAAGTGSLFE